MKRRVIVLIAIIVVMSITVFLLAFNRKPFNKNGTKKNIKIDMMYGAKSQWFFEDNPSEIYKMKSSQVDKIYNVLKIL